MTSDNPVSDGKSIEYDKENAPNLDGVQWEDSTLLLPLSNTEMNLGRFDWFKSLIAGIAATWLTYEPLLNVLGLRSDASRGDEAAALLAGLSVSLIAGATSKISTACAEGYTYKKKRLVGTVAGTGTGVTAATGVLALFGDLALSGGLISSILLASGSAGAGMGYVGSRFQAQKCCSNGHVGKCCERICQHCGFIFAPEEKWKGCVNRVHAEAVAGVAMTWYDVVSVLQGRGVSYSQACWYLEHRGGFWGIKPNIDGGRLFVDRDCFFQWFESQERSLVPEPDKLPSDKIWKVAEKVVRSDCNPLKAIDIYVSTDRSRRYASNTKKRTRISPVASNTEGRRRL